MPFTTKVEGKHTGEFIASEANGTQSRDLGTLASGQTLQAGTVLGRITTGGNLTQWNPGAADGSQNAMGVLYDNVDASAGAVTVVFIARMAEVNDKELVWFATATAPQKAAARTALQALTILVRQSGNTLA
jgi:hypothetical protein